MKLYNFFENRGPLLISVPHAGTWVPKDVSERITEKAKLLPDTDWYVDRLYSFADRLGASLLVSNVSRYVVDLNRSPDNENLYPGQHGPGLCPETMFDGAPVYENNSVPSQDEIDKRIMEYWKPYHEKLANELHRIKQQHGIALLYDAHSILPALPKLFDGQLPDLNLGTANGASCSSDIGGRLDNFMEAQNEFTHVTNGRFVGGYITRHYGDPENNVHAVQMELSQQTYMNTESGVYDEIKSARLQAILEPLVQHFLLAI